MRNKSNTNTKENTMIKETKTIKEIKMSHPMKVAMEIHSGKTEKEVIGLIGQVLRNQGENHQSVNYFMNVDEDFISDVLGCYNSLKFGIYFDGFPCKALRFETDQEATEYRENNYQDLLKRCEYQVGIYSLPNKMRG